MYQYSGTFIQVGHQSLRALKVNKWIRQRDPLSPLLFHLVVDLGLAAIPQEIGYSLGNENINTLAFTDDVILCATTPIGLQKAIAAFTDKLSEAGMKLNATKCVTMFQVPSGE